MQPESFILASTSPRRRQFLKTLEIPFTIIAPGAANGTTQIDETPLPNESPANLVQRLSLKKAMAVVDGLSNPHPHTLVIAADTAVVFDDTILGKPVDANEATRMLKALRSRPHRVYSGLTAAHPSSGQTATQFHESRVWMRSYTDHEIAAYVSTGFPLDKAGAYGIQDTQFAPVDHLDGCFASVMGFPMGALASAVYQLGYTLPEIGPLCRQHTGVPCCQTGDHQHIR